MQIEASHVVTSALRCNTNHQLLETEEQARSAGFYSIKYCGKDQVKVKIIVPVLHMMNKKSRMPRMRALVNVTRCSGSREH